MFLSWCRIFRNFGNPIEFFSDLARCMPISYQHLLHVSWRKWLWIFSYCYFFSSFSFLISLTLNKLRQRQMLEDKLAQRRKRRMEELEQKQMHETKVSNFLNCSQISCLREPETQASMDTFFTRKSTQKRVRKSSPKELFFFVPVTFASRGEWIKTFSHILDLFQAGSRFWKKLTHYLQGNGTDVVILAVTDLNP